MNEFLEQFLIESRELVEQATGDLLALENEPADRERLDSAFRAMHTLKGGAGIVDFPAMSRAMHAAEDTLSALRARKRDVSAKSIGDCLACLDQVVQWLDAIAATGGLPTSPDAAANAVVARFGSSTSPMLHEDGQSPGEASEGPAQLSPTARRILNEQLLLLAQVHTVGREGRVASAGETARNVLHALGDAGETNVDEALAAVLNGGDPKLLTDAIEEALGIKNADEGRTAHRTVPTAVARTIRVDAERVNALVNLTGELIVAKNAIAHVAKLAQDGGNTLASVLRDEQARLEQLTANLQQSVLNLRVVPFRRVFQRLFRVIREMAADLGKPAELVVQGEDTEADRTIVEMLFEPLLHIARNAMDHGLESVSERTARGKAAVGTIRIRAYRAGEHVVVEVIDDGRGIDIDSVRKVAAERGTVAEDMLAGMSERELADLIFAPGFSTASEVSGLSGRGVGMNAVRTAVEQIGGRAIVESTPGQGACVRLIFPFSVMVTRVVTVEAAGQMFGIPLDAVVETVRLARERIQAIGSAGACVIRNRTVPLVDLAALLDRARAQPAPAEAIAVVVSVSGQTGALEVDRIGERMDVMMRPIEGLLAGTPGIAGTTLTGDGQVLLILDIPQLLG